MPEGLQSVSSTPFSLDPAKIDPIVLRMFWTALVSQMPTGQAERVQLMAAAIGQAGVWCSLVYCRRARDLLCEAIEAAMVAAAKEPDLYRRGGSDLVLSALHSMAPGPVHAQAVVIPSEQG